MRCAVGADGAQQDNKNSPLKEINMYDYEYDSDYYPFCPIKNSSCYNEHCLVENCEEYREFKESLERSWV